MTIRFSVTLNARPDQSERLMALQRAFVQACNSLTPLVRDTRCWNRVGLHQMAYRQLRDRFPQLGSQMACNVVYSVSRACRLVYQSKRSPWTTGRDKDGPLPLVIFDADAPVYFDRHTLSLRDGAVSMFTLDGRMRFEVGLSPAQVSNFLNDRLREVVLRRDGGAFSLTFLFTGPGDEETSGAGDEDLPEYLVVKQTASPAALAGAA